jgi:hypothetical protein
VDDCKNLPDNEKLTAANSQKSITKLHEFAEEKLRGRRINNAKAQRVGHIPAHAGQHHIKRVVSL